MLVLSRKVNENIVIDGRIVVKVVRTEGNFVKLGIEAPPDVPVHRQEIYDEIQRNNQAALTTGRPAAQKLPSIKPGSKSSPASPAPISTLPSAATAAPTPTSTPNPASNTTGESD
jgi:carbon storage regulator